VNLARWGESITSMIPGPPNNGAEPPTPADVPAPTSTPCVLVKPARRKRELTLIPHQRLDQMTPERGGADHLSELLDTLWS